MEGIETMSIHTQRAWNALSGWKKDQLISAEHLWKDDGIGWASGQEPKSNPARLSMLVIDDMGKSHFPIIDYWLKKFPEYNLSMESARKSLGEYYWAYLGY